MMERNTATMRRIIFLDIDGVLATGEVLSHTGSWTFTPRCVANLQRILADVPDAELVISSSWREETIQATKDHLIEEGLPIGIADRITGITVRGYEFIRPGVAMSIPRGVEIKQWIDHNIHSGGNGEYVPGRNGTFARKHLGIEYSYVILDDDTDMLLEHAARFVKCHTRKGLTRKLAERAIGILGGERSANTTPPVPHPSPLGR
jgi:hypothetical protein